MSACLVLVRHAQSCFDSDDYDRLSTLGEHQAARLAGWWQAHRPRPLCILSGPLQRQRATAAVLERALQPAQAGVHAGLREFDHVGIFYAHRPDLRDPAALAAWKAEGPDYPARFERTWHDALRRWQDPARAADYAEPWSAFRARCRSALQALAEDLPAGATTLAVTSAGVLAVALQAWSTLPVPAFETLQGRFGNTGWTELWPPARPGTAPRLGTVDALEHLAAGQRSWR